MTRTDCPWYLSALAVSQFARIIHLDPEKDADFDRAEDLLLEVARAAKFVRNQPEGLQIYSSNIPVPERKTLKDRAFAVRKPWSPEHRLTLLVSMSERPEGNLPQLVSVIRRGQ